MFAWICEFDQIPSFVRGEKIYAGNARDRSFSVEIPIVNPRRSSCSSAFSFSAIPPACATERVLRAHNDLKRSRVSRSKVLISVDDLSKSRRVKECQKVCHASENGAKENAVTARMLRSFIGIRPVGIKILRWFISPSFEMHMQFDNYDFYNRCCVHKFSIHTLLKRKNLFVTLR